MAEGAILRGIVHGGEELSLPIKIHQGHNLFDVMGDVDLGAAQGVKGVFCHV
jgi:hypothetical protein